jgi:hypothetical protein
VSPARVANQSRLPTGKRREQRNIDAPSPARSLLRSPEKRDLTPYRIQSPRPQSPPPVPGPVRRSHAVPRTSTSGSRHCAAPPPSPAPPSTTHTPATARPALRLLARISPLQRNGLAPISLRAVPRRKAARPLACREFLWRGFEWVAHLESPSSFYRMVDRITVRCGRVLIPTQEV